MNSRTQVLKELVGESHYVIDPHAVAEAIIVRSLARRLLPDLSFRSAPDAIQVRSFRPHRGARSFRLTRPERRRQQRSGDEPEPSYLR
jgi:hypothetical protein